MELAPSPAFTLFWTPIREMLKTSKYFYAGLPHLYSHHHGFSGYCKLCFGKTRGRRNREGSGVDGGRQRCYSRKYPDVAEGYDNATSAAPKYGTLILVDCRTLSLTVFPDRPIPEKYRKNAF